MPGPCDGPAAPAGADLRAAAAQKKRGMPPPRFYNHR